jgi:hypothetical protein
MIPQKPKCGTKPKQTYSTKSESVPTKANISSSSSASVKVTVDAHPSNNNAKRKLTSPKPQNTRSKKPAHTVDLPEHNNNICNSPQSDNSNLSGVISDMEDTPSVLPLSAESTSGDGLVHSVSAAARYLNPLID